MHAEGEGAPLAGVEVDNLLPLAPEGDGGEGADLLCAGEGLRLDVVAGHLEGGRNRLGTGFG